VRSRRLLTHSHDHEPLRVCLHIHLDRREVGHHTSCGRESLSDQDALRKVWPSWEQPEQRQNSQRGCTWDRPSRASEPSTI